MPVKNNKKRALARKLMSNKEKRIGIPPYDSVNWAIRKIARERKVKKQSVALAKRRAARARGIRKEQLANG